MPLTEIPFTSLEARVDNNRVPYTSALKCDDCFTDTDAVVGRNGSRSVLPTAITASGSPQFMGRFRPSIDSARTVLVIGGQVFLVTDPTSETTSDGSIVSLGTPFGATDTISGAALGTNYYLATDNSAGTWQRIVWSSPDTYTLEGLQSIPQGAQPTANLSGQVQFTAFTTLSAPTVHNCVEQDNTKTGMGNMNSAWRAFTHTDNGNDDPPQGAYANFKLYGSPYDASGNDWLMVAVSPHDDSSSGTTYAIQIGLAIDSAGSPGTFSQIGLIHDVQPVAGSPNLIFCNLDGLDPSVRSAIQWMQFFCYGSNGGKFIVYGWAFLPGKPVDPPPFDYYVDFFDGSYAAGNLTAPLSGGAGDASPLTPVLSVTPGAASLQAYPDSYMANNEPASSTQQDTPLTTTTRDFNYQSAGQQATTEPSLAEIGAVVTITGTAPVFSSPSSLTARLWKATDNGVRLVAIESGVTSGGSYTLIDKGGVQVLANQLYEAQGSAPQGSALGAAQARLVTGYQNEVAISSFTPVGNQTDEVPEWPPIALQTADGWNFDIAPSPEEILTAIECGDDTYILTNEAWYFMNDLEPNSPNFRVFSRGALGPHAACFAESMVFVASWDGVYAGVGRVDPQELTLPIRTLYKQWLAPTAAVVVDYDPNTRSLFIFQGARYLRYCFVQRLDGSPVGWSRGTLSDTVSCAASWIGKTHIVVSQMFSDQWAGAHQSDTLESRSGWNKNPSSASSMSYSGNYAPGGFTGPGSMSGEMLYYRSEVPSSPNYSVECTVYNPIAFGGQWGCALRMDTAADTFYALVQTGDAGQLKLLKHVAGVETVLWTYSIPGWAVGGTDWIDIMLQANGSTLLVYARQNLGQAPNSGSPIPPSGPWELLTTVTDTDITAAGRAGLYANNSGSGGYIYGATSSQTAVASFDVIPQFWLLAPDYWLTRWQASADRDIMVGTDETTGAAIPAWVYSSGFIVGQSKLVVDALMLDASARVDVKLCSLIASSPPNTEADLVAKPVPEQDEIFLPGAAGLPQWKWRFEFTARNTTALRRAAFEQTLIEAK